LQDIQTLSVTVMYYDQSDSSSQYCTKCHTFHSRALPLQHARDSQMICIHPSYAWTTAPLPCDSMTWNMFSQSYLEFNALYYLAVKRVINWCPSLCPLYPILTAGILSLV